LKLFGFSGSSDVLGSLDDILTKRNEFKCKVERFAPSTVQIKSLVDVMKSFKQKSVLWEKYCEKMQFGVEKILVLFLVMISGTSYDIFEIFEIFLILYGVFVLFLFM
jgi:hypothetical protein